MKYYFLMLVLVVLSGCDLGEGDNAVATLSIPYISGCEKVIDKETNKGDGGIKK
ncbi:MAG: hypothetical protein WC997_12855 [Porticoccaceae bacterium]